MDAPIYYNYATALQNEVSPGTLKPHDNITTKYYIRYLLKRAMSVFDFSGIPDNWDMWYFLYVLYCYGFVVVMDSPTFGIIPQAATLGGYGVYRTPAWAQIANPALPVSETGRYWLASDWNRKEYADVKGDCVLVKLQPDFRGVLDICTITAERLAYMHEALIMNLANSKLAYVIGAADKGAAETFKAAIDQIQEGNLAVAAGKNLWDPDTGKPLWEGFANNLKQNYIATELLENMRSELNDFNNFIGIPSTNYNKKAHMTEVEVNANDVETESLIDVMYDSLSAGLDAVNTRFGLSLSVKKRYNADKQTAPEKVVTDNVNV